MPAKMLCGVYPLMLELGRYKNIPEEKRVCLVCDKNVTEDERHFLTKCTILKPIRNKYLPRLKLKGMILDDKVTIDEETKEEEEQEEEDSEEEIERRMPDLFKVENLKVLAEMIEELQEERLKHLTQILK